MSPRTGGRDEGMPQAPDPIGLPDLAPARTEASPPNVPDIREPHDSRLRTNQVPNNDAGDNADDASPRPDLRAFGPNHLVSDSTRPVDGSTLHRYAGRSCPGGSA